MEGEKRRRRRVCVTAIVGFRGPPPTDARLRWELRLAADQRHGTSTSSLLHDYVFTSETNIPINTDSIITT